MVGSDKASEILVSKVENYGAIMLSFAEALVRHYHF